jgi:lysophospholipase L1-like esterase
MRRTPVTVLLVLGLLAAITTTAAAQPATTPTTPTPAPTVLLLIDTSGSMAGTRLDQAKSALTSSINALAAGQRAGLRSYGGGCGDGGLLRVPIAADNRAALQTAVGALTAGGGTPTTDALNAAAADLASSPKPQSIILVSDGESTCGDPCPVAQAIAQQQGIDFTVHTVGFHAPDAAENELACVARVTGGKYFSVDDAAGLGAAIGNVIAGTTPPAGHEYVAVGDSTTTGFSVKTCSQDRKASAFGCVGTPPGTPYPELVARDGGATVDDLQRVGIWGYTATEAVAAADARHNAEGPWEPQLLAAEKATKLVTVSLGVNDMHFSDWKFWLGQCVGEKQKSVFGKKVPTGIEVTPNCTAKAHDRATAPQLQQALDAMFGRLDKAKANGAKVVVTLYYNAMNPVKNVRFAPDRSCGILHQISADLVGAINAELSTRARTHGFLTADLGPAFVGHGAGSSDSYVWGTDCDATGVATAVDYDLGWPPVDTGQTNKKIQINYDPHPNPKGTRAQADVVLGVLRAS